MAITFNTPTTTSTFSSLFTDSESATTTWYQIWAGDSAGTAGGYVDTSAYYTGGNGWIETSDLTSLNPDYAQYDDTTLWVRTWDATNGAGAWASGAVDFTAITSTATITSSVSGATTISQMFNDEDFSSGSWYRIWIGATADESSTGYYLDTSSLSNGAANGWVEATDLGNVSYTPGDNGTANEFWVQAWSANSGSADWEHWTVTSTAVSTGDTMTLTTGVDALTGTSSDDTFLGTETTLGSNDTLDGGDGSADLLDYASSGNTAIAESGFTLSNIETVQVTSDAVGGTTFDVTDTSGVTSLVNDNSSTDLTYTGLQSLTSITMQNVGGTTAAQPDFTVAYQAAVVVGTTDSQTVILNDNITNAGGAIGTLTINGIETLNLMTTGGASSLTAITTGASTINVTGDQNLTIANALAGATTIDANAFTGNLSVAAASTGTPLDVTVTGGTGDDTANFTVGFQAGDSFDGGAGTADTIVLNNATAIGTLGGTLTNVEGLRISDLGTGTLDMDDFTGVTSVNYAAGLTGGVTTTVDEADSGMTVEVDITANTTADLTVDLETDGTADTFTLAFDSIGAGDGLDDLSLDDIETLTITADDDTTTGTGTLTITDLILGDTTTLNLSGDSAVTITGSTDPATPVLATLDASGMTDALTLGATNFAAGGAAITLGSGSDVLTFATAAGADTIDISAGGTDRLVYTAAAQSDDDMDIVTGFTAGSDDIDLRTLGVTTSTMFKGVYSNFSLAQGSLTGTAFDCAFDSSTSILWVDGNGDQTLGNSDFRIQLTGVTTLAASDLSLASAGVTFTANTTGFNTATAANSTEGNAVTNEDDTINATVTQINAAGTTVGGLLGTDTLNITGTGVANLTTGTSDGDFEAVTLATGVTGLTAAALDVTNLVTLTGSTVTAQEYLVTTADDLSGLTVTNVESLEFNNAANTIDEANVTAFSTQIDLNVATHVLTLDRTGTGTFDFSTTDIADTDGGADDQIVLGLAADDENVTATFDAADLAGVDTITGDATDDVVDTLNFNDTTTLAGKAITEIDTFTIAGAAQTLTIDGDDYTAMAAADASEVMTITGSGTSLLTFAVGGAAAALSLVDGTISGIATLNVAAATGGGVDLTLDAASLSGTMALIADATDDLILTETDDLTDLSIATGDFDSCVITDGQTITIDDLTLDDDGTVTSMIAINSSGAASDANLVVNMSGTTFDLGLVTIGAVQDVDTAITGTTGADIIEGALLKTAGSAMTIAGNGGADTFRLSESSGNVHLDDNDVLVVADAVTISDFAAADDSISVDSSTLAGGANATVGTTTANNLNVTTGQGFTYISDSAVADFSNEVGVLAAIGNVTAADNAEFYVALKNVAGSQVAVYQIMMAGANTAAALAAGTDGSTLMGIATVTGTFALANMGIH